MLRSQKRRAFILRISLGKRGDEVPQALKDSELIIGWSRAHGLTDPKLTWKQFRGVIHNTYRYKSYRSSGSAAGSMWRFIRDMGKGDWVVVPHGDRFYVAEVIGNAYHDEQKVDEDTAHRRPVKWLNAGKPIPRALARAALQSRMKSRQTCVYAEDLVEEIHEVLETATQGNAPTSFEEDLRLRLVKETRKELFSGRMDSYAFERLVKAILSSLGASETRIVPRKSDKGADILAIFKIANTFKLTLAVQAKHYKPTPPVPRRVVDQLVNGMEAEDAQLGWIVTSGTFSDAAAVRASEWQKKLGIRIELVDGEQLATLIVESGLKLK